MPDWSTLGLFTVVVLTLVVTPGPNTVYIVTLSIQQGWAAGVLSCCGIAVGTLCHISAAAFGLSLLLLSSELIFNLIQYAGAFFLCFLGLKTMLSPPGIATGKQSASMKEPVAVFRDAFVINLLNPKTTLFFTAFLPQFISPQQGNVTTQVFILGGLVILLGAASDLTYVFIAVTVGERLQAAAGFRQSRRYFIGAVYIGIGLTTVLSGVFSR
ncbi:LysE family translocator [Desulfobulbus oligotrophicus]|uniref:LysE family translocator n=1 Tax=Desulfobulbus oligotrophicus TaxID=1909699 RepID=UPI0022B8F903|nr:LysE family translocator [Desulfobulbus oligotrophicus]